MKTAHRAALGAMIAALSLSARGAAAQQFERPAHLWFFADPSLFGALRTADAQAHLRVRLDVGPAFVREPHFLSAGAMLEYWTPARLAIGGYAQYLDGSSGFGAGVSAAADLQATAILGANIGFAWFFADVRVMLTAPTELWIGLGVRVPLGGILHRAVLDRRRYRLDMQPPSRPQSASPTTQQPATPPQNATAAQP